MTLSLKHRKTKEFSSHFFDYLQFTFNKVCPISLLLLAIIE
ncbi:MAG: hypothetical protein ACI9N9_000989 [Enterobacterales bacterium]|jgi:hypothetical protein